MKKLSIKYFLQISYDIVEDIMVQGDRLRGTLQELQDAVFLTKVLELHTQTSKYSPSL